MASMIKLMATQMEAMETTFLSIFFDAASKMAELTSSKLFFLMETADGTRRIGGHADMKAAFMLATLLPQPSDVIIDSEKDTDQTEVTEQPLPRQSQELSNCVRKRRGNEEVTEPSAFAKRLKIRNGKKSSSASVYVKLERMDDSFEMGAAVENGYDEGSDGEGGGAYEVDDHDDEGDGVAEDVVNGAADDDDGRGSGAAAVDDNDHAEWVMRDEEARKGSKKSSIRAGTPNFHDCTTAWYGRSIFCSHSNQSFESIYLLNSFHTPPHFLQFGEDHDSTK